MAASLPIKSDIATKNDAVHDGAQPNSASDRLRVHPDAEALKQQRLSASTEPTGDVSTPKTATKYLPDVTLETMVLPAGSAQAQFMHLIQTQLSSPSLLKVITAPDLVLPSETGEQYNQREANTLARRQQAINDEMKPSPPAVSHWGPASQEAFKDYINMVQSHVVPIAIAALASAVLPEPPGNPLKMPPGMTLTDYETRAITGKLNLDLDINYRKIPGLEETKKLRNATAWAGKAMDSVKAAQTELHGKQIDATIDKLGFPPAWHANGTRDHAAWMASASDMIDLYSRIARAVSVIDSNHLPVPLPAGVKLTRDADGKITHMVLSMPDDLRQEDPKNATIIAKSRAWLAAADARIQNALKDKNLPTLAYTDTVIPQVVDGKGRKTSAQVRLDKDGNLLELINAAKEPDAKKLNAHDVNLLEERYATEQIFKQSVAVRIKQTSDIVRTGVAAWTDEKKKVYEQSAVNGDGSFSKDQLQLIKSSGDRNLYNAALEHNVALTSPDGYVKVAQHVQAQNVPFFSPENLIYSNVGKPMLLEERFYQPGDLVAVQQGSTTEYVLAKDLGMMHDSQSFNFYGQKALILGLDAAMITMGGVEIAAAIEGAAALGTAEAAVSGGRLLETAGKGILDLSLGASDPLSNGYFASRDGGQAASLRNWAFMGSMGWGLAEQGAALLSSELALGQIQSAKEIGQLIESSDTATKIADKISKEVMMWGQLPMGVPTAANVADQLISLDEPAATRTVAAQAVRDYNGSKQVSEQKTEKNESALIQNASQVQASLENYKVLFQADNNVDAQTKAQISNLFEQAIKVSAEGSEQERSQLMTKLAANLQFTGAELGHLEQLYRARLTQDQIKELMDPDRRDSSSYPRNMRDYASTVLSARSQDLVRASEIMLLSLSRDKSGREIDKVVSSSVDVADYITREEVEFTDLWGKQSKGLLTGHRVSGEKKTIDLDNKYLTSVLKQNFAQPKLGPEAFAIGDALAKSGALNASNLGALMQDLLADNKINESDKLRFLAGEGAINLGEVMLALHAQEESAAKDDSSQAVTSAPVGPGVNFGTRASDLERTLTEVAAKSKSADLKLMAAALLFAAKRTAASKREGAAITEGVMAMYKDSEKNGITGTFAGSAMDALRNQLSASEQNDIQTRLDAAMGLIAARNGLSGEQIRENDNQIAISLAGSFKDGSAEQKEEIISCLLPERMKQLAIDQPVLANSLAVAAIRFVSTSADSLNASDERHAIAMMKRLPDILDASGMATSKAFLDAMHVLLEGRSSFNHRELKMAALATIDEMGATKLIPTLRKLAANSDDAAVRAASLQALNRIPDPQLSQLVDEQIAGETDVRVRQILGNLRFSLDTANGSVNNHDAQTANLLESDDLTKSLAARYPELANFNVSKQAQWLNSNYPLLSQSNFMNTARQAVIESPSGLFASTIDAAKAAIDSVATRRIEQFNSLLALAQIDPAAASSHAEKVSIEEARAVLSSIILTQGKLITKEKESFQPRAKILVLEHETRLDWSAQAADLFSRISEGGNSERDLTTAYISSGLACNPAGATKQALLQAWKHLNTSR